MHRSCALAILFGMASAGLQAATIWVEDFAANPAARGWNYAGDNSLFSWNEKNQNLSVTWDSSKPNSYFYKPLGNILTKSDDFQFRFTLSLTDIAIGTSSNKPYTFQIAVGLFNFGDSTGPDFYRGSGVNPTFGPRNLFEFNYFPDSGFGETFSPTVVSSNNVVVFSDNHPLPLTAGPIFQIEMTYTATDQVLRSRVWRDGQPYGMPPNNTLADLVLTNVPDFRIDTFGVCSYNDGGQSPPRFSGSILAHGTFDNLTLIMPDPPVTQFVASRSTNRVDLSFIARSGWLYELQKNSDLSATNWVAISQTNGITGPTVVSDIFSPTQSFYRVKASRP